MITFIEARNILNNCSTNKYCNTCPEYKREKTIKICRIDEARDKAIEALDIVIMREDDGK